MAIRLDVKGPAVPVPRAGTYTSRGVSRLCSAPESLPREQPPSAHKIRVLLADDFAIIRERLAELLELYSDIEVVGLAANGLQAIQMACQLQPDVVVMDVTMPVLDGVEATRRIHQDLPQVHVIGLSMHDERCIAETMTAAGAVGFVTKTAPPETLIAAIRQNTT